MATSITLRATKGSPLTHAEVDANFTNLKTTADDATTDIATLATKAESAALGVADSDTNMGSYTGTTITDSQTAKQNIQSLETAVETKANASALGVTAAAANMGTFTGTTIPDSQTGKQAFQALETAHETLITNLASDASGKGLELVGFDRAVAYSNDTGGGNLKNQTITVKDNPYLAVGNGVADDTAALVAAATDGREVMFPPGTFLIDPASFTNFLSLKIRGSGRDVTKLVLASTGTALTFSNCPWLQMSDMSIQPTGSAQTLANASGIQLDTGSSNAVFERMNFYGFSLDGLRLIGTAGTTLSGNVVQDCYFLGCGRNQLHSYYANDFHYANNQFGQLVGITHATYGALLENSQEGTYFANKHWNNGTGMKSLNGDGNRYGFNRFEESDLQGVWLENGDDELFEANTVHTNSQTADGASDNVYVKAATRMVFTGNKIRTWNAKYSRWGVNFDTGCDDIVFGKNQIRGFDTTNFGPLRVAGGISRFSGDFLKTGNATSVAAGATVYISSGGQTAEDAAYTPVNTRYAVAKMYIATAAAPGVGETFTYTFRKNGSDTAMTATSSGAASTAATTTSTAPQILLDSGDFFTVKLVTSGGAAVTSHRLYVLLVEY